MGSLRFPEGGLEGLAGKWPNVSDFGSGFPKFLIYSIDSEVYRAAREFDIKARGSRMSESDWDEISYLKPANQDFAAPTLQHILNHHLHIVKQMRAHVERTQHPGDFDWDMCLSGFIAISRADWREHGVTAVYCELDRAKWKVTQCSLPIAHLSRLDSVMEVDEYFDHFAKNLAVLTMTDQIIKEGRLPSESGSLPCIVLPHLPVQQESSNLKPKTRYPTLAAGRALTFPASIVFASYKRYCRRSWFERIGQSSTPHSFESESTDSMPSNAIPRCLFTSVTISPTSRSSKWSGITRYQDLTLSSWRLAARAR
jgi:hypothetical protein